MPFLDRTTELTSIIESRLSSAKSSNQQKKKQQQKSNNNQLQAKFYERASTVSNELQTTADTLQQLTKLVKKKTPFDDNVVQIQSLTASVKEQLARHDYFLREMNELIQQQQQQQQKGDQKTEHSNHIVTGLNSRLMYATQQFQNVLQTRTKQIKQQQERRNIFTSNSSRSQFNKPLYQQPQQQTLQQQPSHFDNNNEVTVHIGGPNQQQQQQQQQQLAVQETVIQVQRNDQHLRMRSDEIKSIEKDMRQLSDMFVELGQMVKMQGELAIRIDDKVSEAVFHIEEGQSELAKYLKRVSSNRGLVLKMFLVMVVFIIFIGVFVV